jgi:hypothetical protein
MTDPRKDPNRRCRPIEAWPIPDRRAWEAAVAKNDILEPGGGRCRLGPSQPAQDQ